MRWLDGTTDSMDMSLSKLRGTTGLDNKDATTPTAHVAQVRMRRAQVGEKTAEVGVEEAVTGTVGLQTQIPVPIPPTLGQE